MPDTSIQLGDFTFADFEVPEELPFGGEQALGVHKLIGGQKVVDAMGWFPRDITFSGRFRGPDATDRARYVQSLFNGQSLTFVWDDFRYQVVGKTFDPIYQRFYEVPYTLTLEVVSDLTAPITVVPSTSVDDQVNADVSSAQSYGEQVGDDGLTTALASMASAVRAIPTFIGASSSQLIGVLSPISNALSVTQSLIQADTDTISMPSTFGGVVGGGEGASLASSLTNQSLAMGALSALYSVNDLLTRMQINIEADGASGAALTMAAGNLYQVASNAFGDPSEWTTIAEANGLSDPELAGLNTIRVPATPSGSQGVWTT